LELLITHINQHNRSSFMRAGCHMKYNSMAHPHSRKLAYL
jgi:hypothetical protein